MQNLTGIRHIEIENNDTAARWMVGDPIEDMSSPWADVSHRIQNMTPERMAELNAQWDAFVARQG